MYAVIETGGKQYKVEKGDTLSVELLDIAIGKVLKFKDLLNGAEVTAKVESHGKGKKINIFTYKPKKNIRKRQGHRQPFTMLKIEGIK
ncbi:MAG: 50S ribosomal protein L21 [Firmicutes bacterium]|nr:50S ribosomal protein L21 [Bacillota bacterium]